jgi:hypothetical protein
MARKKPDSIELSIELALRRDTFISHRNLREFVDGLESVAEQIDRLIKTHPQRAVELFEAFIAACYEKADEVRDSGDSFGMFIQRLVGAWIRARQTAKADPHETVKHFLHWIENDNSGPCYGIEKHAVKSFNKRGLRACVEMAHQEWKREVAQKRVQENEDRDRGSVRLRWLADVLRAAFAQQRNLDRYLPREAEAAGRGALLGGPRSSARGRRVSG